MAGVHQHYFTRAAARMTLNVGDSLVAYVFLDPTSPPQEIMLQWSDGDWDQRAYWGANLIPWGSDGSQSRRYMGPLPRAGGWVRLEVPVSLVGLENSTVDGLAFTLHGGRATWDRAGKNSPTPAQLHLFTATPNDNGVAVSLNNSTQTSGIFDMFTFPNFGSDPRTHLTVFATGIRARARNTDLSNDVSLIGIPRPNLAESVTLEARAQGGRVLTLPVLFAGVQGDLPGLDECVFVLPSELQGAGNVALTLVVNGERSNSPSIMIR